MKNGTNLFTRNLKNFQYRFDQTCTFRKKKKMWFLILKGHASKAYGLSYPVGSKFNKIKAE